MSGGQKQSWDEPRPPHVQGVTPELDVLEAWNFLRLLAPEADVHLTAIPLKKGRLCNCTIHTEKELDKLDAWLRQRDQSHNFYYHVNPLNTRNRRATRTDVKEVAWLFVDLDPRKGKNLREEQVRLWSIVSEWRSRTVPEPTVVVFSGGGYQLLWKLREGIDGDDAEGCARAEAINKLLIAELGGDKVFSREHLLRLAGTPNLPSPLKQRRGRTAALARLVTWTGESHDLESFPQPRRVVASRPRQKSAGDDVPTDSSTALADSSTNVDDLPVSDLCKSIIREGHDPARPNALPSRSEWLWKAVLELARADVPPETIVRILLDPNHRISAHVSDQSNPREYAKRQAERAHDAVRGPAELIELNDRHAFICSYGGRARVLCEPRGDGDVVFQPVSDFLQRYSHRYVDIPRQGRGFDRVPLGKWWMNHAGRREYESVEFIPGATQDEVGRFTYNLWRGWAIESSDGDCEPFLQFLLDVICCGNAEWHDWLLDWMSHAIQCPGVASEVAVVLRGGQGIGKSFFAERFGELFGRHFLPVSDVRALTGNFNAHLQEKLLVFADEAFHTGKRAHEGILKAMVTQPTIFIEPKGVDGTHKPRYFRLILASNSSWVVPVSVQDRRFFVLDVSPARQKDTSYFRRLSEHWRSGGREAFFEFLRRRDLSEFNHRDRPTTPALVEQWLHSLRGAPRVVYELLSTGEAPVVESSGDLVFVPTSQVKAVFERRFPSIPPKSLGTELAKCSRNQTTERRTRDARERGVWLPPLAEARRRWAAAHHQEVVWEEDGEWPVPRAAPF